ncbi:gas vesicle protein K [Actinomadura macrotermitis]|uniref:Gas vesicle protein K n=1 Tax=Actinomadura macrotermitis TaxID=2585200 RepID=A0A7K0C5N7_9ACTN|nr:gas vesicle protein K [Actinomadura macrotermitis]MQY08755.1 hypothetical protein [Actinomadura macrotermitis]
MTRRPAEPGRPVAGEVTVRAPALGDPVTDAIVSGRTAHADADDAPVRAAPVRTGVMQRLRADPENVERGLVKLVLTLVELIRQLMERQALRRVEGGTLTDEETERLGVALMRLEEAMTHLKDHFDLSDEDLNLDLGPLGPLLPD